MSDLCTIADIEALLGYPIPPDQTDRVNALISMASSVVESVTLLPADVPPAVAYVTASLVVRTMANPGQLTSEAIGTYHAGYSPNGMSLTDADREVLDPWLVVSDRAYSVCTPAALPCGMGPLVPPPWDWERDLDPEARW